jgi:hypothetical protein
MKIERRVNQETVANRPAINDVVASSGHALEYPLFSVTTTERDRRFRRKRPELGGLEVFLELAISSRDNTRVESCIRVPAP